MSRADVERGREETRQGARFIHAHDLSVLDQADDEVARVSRELYFRRAAWRV